MQYARGEVSLSLLRARARVINTAFRIDVAAGARSRAQCVSIAYCLCTWTRALVQRQRLNPHSRVHAIWSVCAKEHDDGAAARADPLRHRGGPVL